ncbi:MAG: hypothetical protein FWG74_01630 [Planctomycetes bacterium]|nr:hypothetical protein [Planctomycetota bacterium]
MPTMTLSALARRLSEADIEHLLVLKRAGPKLERLEAQRQRVVGQLAEVEARIAELSGGGTPKAKRRPGRRQGPKPAVKGKPNRRPPAKTTSRGKPAPKPGRKPITKPGAAAGREAMLARMAKMRAVRAAKREASPRGKA